MLHAPGTIRPVSDHVGVGVGDIREIGGAPFLIGARAQRTKERPPRARLGPADQHKRKNFGPRSKVFCFCRILELFSCLSQRLMHIADCERSIRPLKTLNHLFYCGWNNQIGSSLFLLLNTSAHQALARERKL